MVHPPNSGTGWPAFVALGLACLAGCLEEAGDGTVETPALTGSIRNTCGPADGPAIGIRVDRGAPGGCRNNLDYLDTTHSKYVMQFEDIYMDSIRVGRSYADTQEICDSGRCEGRMIFRFTADQVKADEVRGGLQIRTKRDGLPEVTTETPIILAICPDLQGCG